MYKAFTAGELRKDVILPDDITLTLAYIWGVG